MSAALEASGGAAPGAAQLPYTDALPYYDQEMDTIPGLRAAVEAEIEGEKSKLNYDPISLLPPAHPLFAEKETFAAELARAERGEKLDVLDTSRYQLPPPAGGLDASEEAWASSVQNAEVQLAHMDGRLKNIELLRRYGRTSLDSHSECLALAQL